MKGMNPLGDIMCSFKPSIPLAYEANWGKLVLTDLCSGPKSNPVTCRAIAQLTGMASEMVHTAEQPGAPPGAAQPHHTFMPSGKVITAHANFSDPSLCWAQRYTWL